MNFHVTSPLSQLPSILATYTLFQSLSTFLATLLLLDTPDKNPSFTNFLPVPKYLSSAQSNSTSITPFSISSSLGKNTFSAASLCPSSPLASLQANDPVCRPILQHSNHFSTIICSTTFPPYLSASPTLLAVNISRHSTSL